MKPRFAFWEVRPTKHDGTVHFAIRGRIGSLWNQRVQLGQEDDSLLVVCRRVGDDRSGAKGPSVVREVRTMELATSTAPCDETA
jgi:hypothetical protein